MHNFFPSGFFHQQTNIIVTGMWFFLIILMDSRTFPLIHVVCVDDALRQTFKTLGKNGPAAYVCMGQQSRWGVIY